MSQKINLTKQWLHLKYGNYLNDIVIMSLDRNNITSVNINAFDGLNYLKIVYLSNNYLKKDDVEILRKKYPKIVFKV